MSYQVLARQWRPTNFDELVGQEHVRRALTNALDENRLHHAYLFTGTRGVGKTTIARIFARSLNCETGVTSKPCGQCDSCREISEGRFIDLIEVDAASRTGVDDTRELLDNVQYAPSRGRYKVYLIDEVHMFSKSSFNALLKTLEEPPPHVKFILATTDPQKLPVTVLSRCLQFNLKRLPVTQIISHLEHILTNESIAYELPAVQLIAEGADGSMRDALSLLDQALAYGAGSIKSTDVRDMMGTVSRDKVMSILRALIENNAQSVMQCVSELAELSPDFESVLAELLSLLHHMAIAQSVPDVLDDYVSAKDELLQLSEQVSAEDLQLFYQVALMGRKDLPLAPAMRSGFEMIMLRMLAFRPVVAGKVYPATTSNNSSSVQTVAEPVAVQTPGESAQQKTKASPQSGSAGDWRGIIEELPINGMVKQLASNCVLKKKNDDRIELVLNEGHRQLMNDKAVKRLKHALSEYFDTDIQLNIEIEDVSMLAVESPAQADSREKQERQLQAEDSIEQDEFVQSLKKNFNARVVPGSVKPVDN